MSGVVVKTVKQCVQGCCSATGSTLAMGCSLPARALLHLWTRHLLQAAGSVGQQDEWVADRGISPAVNTW